MSDNVEMTPEEQITYHVAEQIVELIVSGAKRTGPEAVDPDAAIDGVLLGLALIMEQAPEYTEETSLMPACDRFAARLYGHLRLVRASFNDSGVHPIDFVLDRFRQPEQTN